MSRIGKKPIILPAGVKLVGKENEITITGPRGSLSMNVPEGIAVDLDNGAVHVRKLHEDRLCRSYHGLVRTLIGNMVAGVSAGFEKTLVITGVGYRAELADGKLKLLIGYSGPVEYIIPAGVSVKVDKQVNVTVSGIDKQNVGRVAAEIKELKKPEPYKGKGIRYATETVRRKVGKSVGSK